MMVNDVTITVVDYGTINLKNILRGFEYVGLPVISSSDPKEIAKAEKMVLPGVGAFPAGMRELRRQGIDIALQEAGTRGCPILGICLGMHLLLERSFEGGEHEGLGLIPGEAVGIPKYHGPNEEKIRKIPNVGWRQVVPSKTGLDWRPNDFGGVPPGSFFYFVHSFMSIPRHDNSVVGTSDYDGIDINAIIKQGNIIGVQFHPERSGPAGLELLKWFGRFNFRPACQ
jgi:imidazole glycerol-phosphate synthase subunit HisH